MFYQCCCHGNSSLVLQWHAYQVPAERVNGCQDVNGSLTTWWMWTRQVDMQRLLRGYVDLVINQILTAVLRVQG
jgi:hypothetical protein